MPNKNYIKGRRKEYALKKLYEAKGWIVIRSAGSHSFADLIAIEPYEKVIRFIQVKPNKVCPSVIKDLNGKWGWINMSHFKGEFVVE
jgi:Holliday junction resolvase